MRGRREGYEEKGPRAAAFHSGPTTDGFSQYNKLYGLASFGLPTNANPAMHVLTSGSLPVATAAGPLRWQPPVALP